MKDESYAAISKRVKLMVIGLRNHLNDGGTAGIDAAFIDNLERLDLEAESIDAEQEALKARLKEKTAAFLKTQAELDRQYALAHKRVKLDHPVESWKEYGITDKR